MEVQKTPAEIAFDKKTPQEILFERAQKAKGNKYTYSFIPAKVFDRAIVTLPIKNYTSSNGRTCASFYYFDIKFIRQPPSNIISTK
jgi:hypothetical protein